MTSLPLYLIPAACLLLCAAIHFFPLVSLCCVLAFLALNGAALFAATALGLLDAAPTST